MSALRECVGYIFGLSSEQIDNNVDFHKLGMDSLMALELTNLLETHLGNEVLSDMTTIFEYRNIEGLANYLEEKLASSAKSSVTKTIVQAISSEDLEKIEHYVKKLLHPSLFRRMIRKISRMVFFGLCKMYFRINVKGIENLHPNKSFIICANHSSYLDGVALRLASQNRVKGLVGLLAQEYFSSPVFPFISLISDLVPFDRTPNEYALQKNLKCIELCQQASKVIVIFPEGTRSKDGQLQEFKNGIAWFAHQTGLEIIPAYIEGASRLMPRGSFFPKWGRLSVTFGERLNIRSEISENSDVSDSMVYQKITVKLRQAILSLKVAKI